MRIEHKSVEISPAFLTLMKETQTRHDSERQKFLQDHGADMLREQQEEIDHFVSTHKKNIGIPDDAVAKDGKTWEYDAQIDESKESSTPNPA